MERALVFAGYEVNHVWGDGGHTHHQSDSIFPDAMRWLWKDWPTPVKRSTSSPSLAEFLIPGEEWQLAASGYQTVDGAASNQKGEVLFSDTKAAKTYKIAVDGTISLFIADSKGGGGQAFGPNERLYTVAGKDEKILAYDADLKSTVLADGFRGNDLVVLHNGNIYVTESGWNGKDPSQIWLIQSDGKKRVVDTGLKFANGITPSPDQSLLYVDDSRSRWVYSYQIQPDGSLGYKQKFYHLHLPDSADDSGADAMKVDSNGWLYVATRMGVQICDQAGRVNAIVPTPNGKISSLCFGGEKFDTLFATCGDKVFKRKLKVHGASAWDTPIKPAPPKL